MRSSERKHRRHRLAVAAGLFSLCLIGLWVVISIEPPLVQQQVEKVLDNAAFIQ